MKKLLILLTALILVGCQGGYNNLDESFILSLKEAKEIALSHGFLNEDDVEFIVEELIDANPSYYLLVINEEDKNHMYKIDTKGKILVSSDQETKESISKEQEKAKENKTEQESEKSKTQEKTQTQEHKPQPQTPQSKPAAPKVEEVKPLKNISRDQALQIALKDSGLTQSQINRLEIKEKIKNNIKVIEVEFYHNNYEYEYYIVIADGSILKKEIEYKGSLNNSSPVTIAQAKQLALTRVSGANDNHIKIKEDYEDGRKVFEGKIIYNGFEYEFEIDANSGIFLEWEVERLY